ncbi:MAG: HEAT repeat domain-containing protein [Acidobacteria bacterium]|nr:HEAT repeat domain-containing protein [Acidobacteriota bacterium]
MRGNGRQPSADPPAAANPDAPRAAAAGGARRKTPWPLVVVALLFVIVPFLSWYWTTFLRPLDDQQIEEYLNDREKPRRVQHALEQIDKRIEAGDAGVGKWYPQIVALAAHPAADVRMTAAWVMGDDNRSAEFRASLLGLVEDTEPAVRRMAALSLSRFGEARARPELLAMLRPFDLRAPAGGPVLSILPAGSHVRRESLIARVRERAGGVREVRSPLAGAVERVVAGEGLNVEAGGSLCTLAPDPESVLQSLRALALVGGGEDLPEIERYARGVEGMPGDVQKQAALTAGAVKGRVGKP